MQVCARWGNVPGRPAGVGLEVHVGKIKERAEGRRVLPTSGEPSPDLPRRRTSWFHAHLCNENLYLAANSRDLDWRESTGVVGVPLGGGGYLLSPQGQAGPRPACSPGGGKQR